MFLLIKRERKRLKYINEKMENYELKKFKINEVKTSEENEEQLREVYKKLNMKDNGSETFFRLIVKLSSSLQEKFIINIYKDLNNIIDGLNDLAQENKNIDDKAEMITKKYNYRIFNDLVLSIIMNLYDNSNIKVKKIVKEMINKNG